MRFSALAVPSCTRAIVEDSDIPGTFKGGIDQPLGGDSLGAVNSSSGRAMLGISITRPSVGTVPQASPPGMTIRTDCGDTLDNVDMATIEPRVNTSLVFGHPTLRGIVVRKLVDMYVLVHQRDYIVAERHTTGHLHKGGLLVL